MVTRLHPVTTDFLTAAPVRLVCEARLGSSPGSVYRELADDASSWPLWFREARSVAYIGQPPYGVGAGRSVVLRGGIRFVESVIVAEPSQRFVYRVEEAGLPGVHAWMEEWLLRPAEDGGTLLRFTIAMDGDWALCALMRLSAPMVARALRRAAARLDARCAATD